MLITGTALSPSAVEKLERPRSSDSVSQSTQCSGGFPKVGHFFQACEGFKNRAELITFASVVNRLAWPVLVYTATATRWPNVCARPAFLSGPPWKFWAIKARQSPELMQKRPVSLATLGNPKTPFWET